MKPWTYRSTAVLLTASLLVPLSSAYAASTPAVPQPLPGAISGELAAVAAASSNVKFSKDRAQAIAQRLVSGSGMELTHVSFRSPDLWRTFPEWSFTWTKKSADQTEEQAYTNISIHANTGELTSYSHYDQKAGQVAYAQRISYEEALQKAEAFLKAHGGDKANSTRLSLRTPPPKTPLNADTPYYFSFARVVDGILFPDNGIDISVNAAGTVTSYNMNWDDEIRFAKPDNPVSIEEATEKLSEATKPALSYIMPWNGQGDLRNKPLLAYNDPFSFLINAADGTVLTQSLVPRTQIEQPEPVSNRALTANHQGKALSQEEAARLATRLFQLSGFELRSAYYSENSYRKNLPVWDLTFEKQNGKEVEFANVSIDAQTGDVYSFSKNRPIPLKESAAASQTDISQWKEKATETIRKWTPTLADQFYWNEHSASAFKPEVSEFTLSFQRYVGEVAAASGSASVTFDSDSGEVIYYFAEIGQEEYPEELPETITPEEAADTWWAEAEVEAVYVLQPYSPADKRRAETSSVLPKRDAMLVYRATPATHEQPYFLDAVTGEWRSQSSGKPIDLHRENPSDLEGHPAAKELLLMYEYDALTLIDGKIMPEKEITRGEMIEMLMISLNNGRYYPLFSSERKASFGDVSHSSRYFSAVENAVDYGLLDRQSGNLRPDEPITREELASMIVRALGYNSLAEYSDMFSSNLTDIANAKERGAIIIASRLGIIPTTGQQFQPQATVSRADAAITFSRFLEKRSELQPKSPLRF